MARTFNDDGQVVDIEPRYRFKINWYWVAALAYLTIRGAQRGLPEHGGWELNSVLFSVPSLAAIIIVWMELPKWMSVRRNKFRISTSSISRVDPNEKRNVSQNLDEIIDVSISNRGVLLKTKRSDLWVEHVDGPSEMSAARLALPYLYTRCASLRDCIPATITITSQRNQWMNDLGIFIIIAIVGTAMYLESQWAAMSIFVTSIMTFLGVLLLMDGSRNKIQATAVTFADQFIHYDTTFGRNERTSIESIASIELNTDGELVVQRKNGLLPIHFANATSDCLPNFAAIAFLPDSYAELVHPPVPYEQQLAELK